MSSYENNSTENQSGDTSYFVRKEDIYKRKDSEDLTNTSLESSSSNIFKQLYLLSRENSQMKDRIEKLENTNIRILNKLKDLDIKIEKSGYEIIDELVNEIFRIQGFEFKDFNIVAEFINSTSMRCWIVIPVNTGYSEKDFEDYNKKRLRLISSITKICELYDNCSINVVADFEFEDIKQKIKIDLEYELADLLKE